MPSFLLSGSSLKLSFAWSAFRAGRPVFQARFAPGPLYASGLKNRLCRYYCWTSDWHLLCAFLLFHRDSSPSLQRFPTTVKYQFDSYNLQSGKSSLFSEFDRTSLAVFPSLCSLWLWGLHRSARISSCACSRPPASYSLALTSSLVLYYAIQPYLFFLWPLPHAPSISERQSCVQPSFVSQSHSLDFQSLWV